MKIYKKVILIIVALIFLITTTFLITQVYAKYISSATGNASIPISRWNIIVNDTQIKNNSDISSKIIPVFPGNENIASNIIAPTAEGYFDLNFLFEDVDVSFKYEISIIPAEESAVKDLVATGYSIDNGEKVEFTDYNSPITDTINLADNITKRNIRVFVKWNDDINSATMDNAADTASTSLPENSAIFNVKIAFSQVV